MTSRAHGELAGSRRTLLYFAATGEPPSWKYDVASKIRLLLSMHIYLRNNPAKFHLDPIWNDRLKVSPNKNNKMSSNMRLVPGLKILSAVTLLNMRTVFNGSKFTSEAVRCPHSSHLVEEHSDVGLIGLTVHGAGVLQSGLFLSVYIIGYRPIKQPRTPWPARISRMEALYHITGGHVRTQG